LAKVVTAMSNGRVALVACPPVLRGERRHWSASDQWHPALQTYGSFEYKGDKVHFEIGKKPTKDGLLKSFVEMLIRFRSKL
jgi:hypothetical protein